MAKNAMPSLLLAGGVLFLLYSHKKKPCDTFPWCGKGGGTGTRPQGIGEDSQTPWFLMEIEAGRKRVEQLAESCSKPDVFREHALSLLQIGLDKFRDEQESSGEVYSEDSDEGRHFKEALQATIDGLYNDLCGA